MSKAVAQSGTGRATLHVVLVIDGLRPDSINPQDTPNLHRLRTEGVDLKSIGLFALIGFPYTWKFLWAPVMDRYTIPTLGRDSESRFSRTSDCE